MITSIEISERYVKLSQVSFKDKRPKVLACAVEEIMSAEPQAAATALDKMLKATKIKPGDIVIAVPRQAVTVKIIKLPSREPREIEEMAGFQALKQIPYSKEEMVYGFNLIGIDSDGYSDVMLVICHRSAIDRPIGVLKICGLTPSKATLSSFGLLNWFNMREDLKNKADLSPVILVECDSYSSDISIVHKGKLIYTRGVGFGASGSEDYSRRLSEEIGKTLAAYNKESIYGGPSGAIFTGNISVLERTADEIESRLNMPVEFIDSFKDTAYNLTPDTKRLADEIAFSSVIGAALGGEGPELLSKAFKARREVELAKREFMISIILILAIAFCAFLIIGNKMLRQANLLKSLEAESKRIAPVIAEIDKMKSVNDVIRSQADKKSEALKVFNEVHKVIPPQIYLAYYSYNGATVELKGMAVSSGMSKFVDMLESSPYFENVKLKGTVNRKAEDDLVDFEIICPLSEKIGSSLK